MKNQLGCWILVGAVLFNVAQAESISPNHVRRLFKKKNVKALQKPKRLNSTERAQFKLGQALFFDKEISGPRNVSCASCHHPYAGTSDDLAFGFGHGGKGIGRFRRGGLGVMTPRNSQALFNIGETGFDQMFWDGRADRPYVFLGNPSKLIKTKKEGIYISFGSVVMGNLWDKNPRIKPFIIELLSYLAEKYNNEKVTFVTQGRDVLPKYPKSWMIKEFVNQNQSLAESEVFLTHGGNNSLQEAFIQQTPMVTLPFFGDQLQVAETVEYHHLGKKVLEENFLDSPKDNKLIIENCIFQLDLLLNKSEKNMDLTWRTPGRTDIEENRDHQ